MKLKLFFLSVVALLYLSCSNGKKETGEDVCVSACEYNNPTKELGIGMLVIMNDSTEPFVIYEDSTLEKGTVVNYVGDSVFVCPYFFKPDYNIVQFAVISEHKDYFEIMYNSNKVGCISRNSPFIFKPWDEYLLELPLGAHLRNDSTVFEILKVSSDSILTSDNRWIKWKEGNEFLIQFHFIM